MKMPMPTTGIYKRSSGFTFLELLVVMVILGIGVTMLSSTGGKVLESMRYRSAVKDLVTSLSSTRYAAITSGQIKDIEIRPRENQILVDGELHELPKQINVEVISAAELSRNGVGIIRFYPDGSSSGGSIEVSREDNGGVSIHVDWLVGRVSQQELAGL